MEEVCRRIKAIDPNCIPLGCDSESNLFINLCAQYGSDYVSATGDHYLFNNKTNRRFVKMLNGWYNDGLITTQNIYGSHVFRLFVGDDYNGARCYMSISSNAGAKYNLPKGNKFEVGIAPIPQVDPSNPKVVYQGPSLCIFVNRNISDAEVVASWLFIKFLSTNPGFQASFSMTSGYMPVIESATKGSLYRDFLNDNNNIAARTIKVALEQSDAYFSPDAFKGCEYARYQVGHIMEKSFSLNGYGIDAKIKKLFEEAIKELKSQR
jgi:multiple sugar transport system substrate-binding protein